MNLTKNYKLEEFKCKDGTPVPKDKIPNVKLLSENIQIIRDALGSALMILSGYRTKKHNKTVGGATNSEHLNAKAGDLYSREFTPKQVHAMILKLIKAGKIRDGGVSLYPTFVHYDVGKPRRWYYNK